MTHEYGNRHVMSGRSPSQVLLIIGLLVVFLLLNCTSLSAEPDGDAVMGTPLDVLSKACEYIAIDKPQDALVALDQCVGYLSLPATRERNTEIEVVRTAGFAVTLRYILEDIETGKASVADSKDAANAIQSIVNQRLVDGVLEIEVAHGRYWEDAKRTNPKAIEGLEVETGNSISDICADPKSEECRQRCVKLGMRGPHPSLVYIKKYVLPASHVLVEDTPAVEVTRNPSFDRDYLKLHGVSDGDPNRLMLLAFSNTLDGVRALRSAPSLSGKLRPDYFVGKKRMSERFDAYSDAYNCFFEARKYAVHDRLKALCYSLGIEAGKGMLSEWKLDHEIFAGGRFLDNHGLRDMLSQDRKALKSMGINVTSVDAGFGTGIIHGITSPFRLFGIFGLKFAYPSGVGTWPEDYMLGVFLGGLILAGLLKPIAGKSTGTAAQPKEQGSLPFEEGE